MLYSNVSGRLSRVQLNSKCCYQLTSQLLRSWSPGQYQLRLCSWLMPSAGVKLGTDRSSFCRAGPSNSKAGKSELNGSRKRRHASKIQKTRAVPSLSLRGSELFYSKKAMSRNLKQLESQLWKDVKEEMTDQKKKRGSINFFLNFSYRRWCVD